ncbi:hypothetical protein Taro_011484, partial [Colocasia esculenta]|nr:hypothetical protein [Colocasia esculenta]
TIYKKQTKRFISGGALGVDPGDLRTSHLHLRSQRGVCASVGRLQNTSLAFALTTGCLCLRWALQDTSLAFALTTGCLCLRWALTKRVISFTLATECLCFRRAIYLYMCCFKTLEDLHTKYQVLGLIY